MSTSVVIAGAGPTGLMLAHELALAGVPVVVLERALAPGGSRALGFHARSLEAFDLRGLGDAIRAAEPAVWPRTHFSFFWLDVDSLDPRDHILVHPQEHVERLLEARATALGAQVRRGHEVVGVRQDAEAVTVTVVGPDGAYDLRADYLVGADGGNGPVAGLSGFTFAGDGRRHYGIMGDVEVEAGQDFTAGLYPGGLFGAIPLGPTVTRLMTTEFRVEPPGDDVPVTADELADSIERVIGQRIAFSEPRWLHRFDNATRQAEEYRLGRVLLAGDAAHPHFPSGAQGVNLGIHDALNLGWKLAAVVKGTAPESLLDTYHAERHPVGRRACLNAEAQVALYHPLDRVSALRTFVSEIVALPVVARHLNDMVTGLNTRYATITGVAAAAPAEVSDGTRQYGGDADEDVDPYADVHPLLGRLLPDQPLAGPASSGTAATLHAGRGVLLDLTGGKAAASRTAGAWRHVVDVVEAEPPAALEALDAAALLLRPDGYVAWVAAGSDADATDGLAEALTTWFGNPAAD